MSNGLEIKTKEEFASIYRKQPELAIGIIGENIINVKSEIEKIKSQFHYEIVKCERKIKTNKVKNFLLQFPGGIIGGALVFWIIFKFWILNILNTK